MMPKTRYQPLGGNEMPRFGGPATMMRLPSKESAAGLDVCFVGVPFDIGTCGRKSIVRITLLHAGGGVSGVTSTKLQYPNNK